MIKIEGLNFKFHKAQKPLFNDFNMELKSGNIYGLLGKNGAGKSTLIYLMTGLLTPQKGTITFNGIDVRKRLPEVTGQTFLVPEEFELPEITLHQYIDINAPFYPNFSLDNMKRNLEIFEISDQNVNLKHLSMGQKKKVFMSFALATNTDLVIMDEPTNGLDIPGKSQFRKLIASSMTDNRTIIISTHQVHDIDTILDHVMLINNSEVIIDASIYEIGTKLSFEITNDTAGALYVQPTINGNLVVKPNTSGQETMLDLESLFNATIQNPQQMKELFK